MGDVRIEVEKEQYEAYERNLRRLERTFREVDTSGTGLLTRDAFRLGVTRAIACLNFRLERKVVESMVDSCDIHHTGLFSCEAASQALAFFLTEWAPTGLRSHK